MLMDIESLDGTACSLRAAPNVEGVKDFNFFPSVFSPTKTEDRIARQVKNMR